MKQIIYLILIALTIVCAICCSEAVISLNTDDNEKTSEPPRQIHDSLSYELKQKHYETWHQVEHYFGSNKEIHHIIDINSVWLEFSDGYCTDSVLLKISYTPLYTDEITCENINPYINSTIYYDNGFKIGEAVIECSFIPENSDSLIFSVDNRNIEFPISELLYCPITPISLHINNADNKYIYSALLIEIYHPDNAIVIGNTTSAVESTETMEIPINIRYKKGLE